MAKGSTGTRVFMSMIGLMLALAGGIFSWLMWASFSRAKEVDQWAVVPCAILESEVESRRDDPDWPQEMPQEYRFRVRYSYEWQGKEYENERFRLRGAPWYAHPGRSEKLAEDYPVGSVAECRVNPADPQQSVLRPESKAPGYSLWFPLIFVVGGLGVVVGAWRRK